MLLRPSLDARWAFFDQFATLVNSGSSVLKSLDFLGTRAGSPRLAKAVNQARLSVQNGGALSEAFSAQPGLLDESQAAILKASERSGRLEEGLRSIAKDLAFRREVRRLTLDAFRYPIVLVHVAILIPPIRLLLDSTGLYLKAVLPALVGCYALGAGVWFLRGLAWRVAEVLPLIGKPLRALVEARLLQTMQALYSSGIHPVEVIQLSVRASGNPHWVRAAGAARRHFEQGGRFHEMMRTLPGLSPLVVDQVAVGEESGGLDEVLSRIALRSRQEAEHAVKLMVSLLGKALYFLAVLMMALQALSGFASLLR